MHHTKRALAIGDMKHLALPVLGNFHHFFKGKVSSPTLTTMHCNNANVQRWVYECDSLVLANV